MLRQQSATAAKNPDTWAQVFHATQGTPAVSFAVAGNSGVLWSAALGMADLELAVPALPEHLFRLGSVSKAVTATAAARLVSRGLLELDVPISYWLPELPPHHRPTTLRQLLTHRGGVRHYLPKDVDPAQPGGPVLTRASWTRERVLAAFVDDPLIADAGERVSYSSWGYTLASLAMEAAVRQDFLELIETELAAPFGLGTLVADQPGRIVPGRARGYVGAEERRRLREQFPEADWPPPDDGWANALPLNPAFCWAGAGFLMSMPDLACFGAAHLDGPGSRITPEERALLFTPVTEATEASPPLGLGWRVDRDARGRARWHHAGATPGGRCALVIFPDKGLSVALASNTMTIPGDVLGPVEELADCFV